MALDYVWEKLMVAVSGMAASEQSLQERLADAYVSSLIRLDAEDLPGELQEDFRALEDAMGRVNPTGDEGSARASTRRMSTEEARQWIGKIVSMYDDVTMRGPWQNRHDAGEE